MSGNKKTKQSEAMSLRGRDKPSESGTPDGATASEILPEGLNPELLAAMRIIIREELNTRLEPIETTLKEIVDIKHRIEEVETAISDTSGRLESLTTDSLPSLTESISRMMEELALQTLELDMHRRKWNLCIHGVKGVAREPAATTRALCIELAKQYLQVPDAAAIDFAAAHRLSGSADAGIILRFNDLSKRDAWLAGARYLKQHPDRVTVSPDLPKKIRSMKTELLNLRKELPDEQKTLARIRHLPQWPFVELTTPGNDPVRPSMTKSELLSIVTDLEQLKFT